MKKGIIKVGVIGVGKMGERHVQIFQQIPGVEVVAIADVNPSRVDEVASKYNIPKGYTNYEKLLQCQEVDAVTIATPDAEHKAPAIASAEARKHILLEKPIATNLEDAKEIITAARKNNVILMVGYIARYFPQFKAIKRMLDQGKIGKPLFADFLWLNALRRYPDDYGKELPPRRDSIITFLATHPVDLMRWYFGDVRRVYCEADTFTWGRSANGPEDTSIISLRFKEGQLGQIAVCWGFGGTPYTARFVATIIGDEGAIHGDSLNDGLIVASAREGYELPIHYDWKEALRAELCDFLDAVRNNVSPPISGEEAMKVLEITLAAIESMKTQRPVELC